MRLAGRLLALLTAVEGPQTYAALRIGLGALVIANVSTLWPHIDYLYGDLGIAPAARVCGGEPARLSILCHLPEWGPQVVLVAFTIAALAFTLGLATRVSGISTMVLYASLWARGSTSWAGEHVFADFLFLLCFARCGEAWSLDRWLRARREGPTAWRAVPSWPRYLMILQLTLCLGVNGWIKSGEEWRSGDALHYVLAADRYHRFPPWTLLATLGPTMMRAWTHLAWLTERCFPLVAFGLLLRPWLRSRGAPRPWLRVIDWLLGRRVWAPLAVALLLGITVLLNIGWFAPATAVAVLCLFRGDELGRLLTRTFRLAPAPAPVYAPSAPLSWRLLFPGLFMLWHGWVITTHAIRPLTGELVVPSIAAVMAKYERYTGTTQYWQMFSPGIARQNHLLRVVVVTADGERVDAPSDLDMLDHGRRIKIGYDRRQKIHAMLIQREAKRARTAHARWVCNTWRDASGRPPTEVVLIRVDELLPPPAWPATHGAVDPHDGETMVPREKPLTALPCPVP